MYTYHLVQSKGGGCCEASNSDRGQKGVPEVDASKTRLESACYAGSSNPCICCLGILHTLDGTVQEQAILSSSHTHIVEAIKKGGHQINTFCMEVTIPGVVMVRERAVWQYLQEKHGALSDLQGKQLSEHVVPLKEALKWVLVKPLEQSLQARHEIGSALKIALIFKHLETVNDLGFPGYSLPASTKRKRDVVQEGVVGVPESGESLAAIQRCLASMSFKTFGDLYPCPPSKSVHFCQANVSCHRMPIYIGGRYLKLSRNLSQTRWLIDDERMGDGSVQEIIADIVFPHFKADSYKFHAAGREDIDVRMLGTGRPFMLEVLNARTLLSCEEVEKLQELINNSKDGWVKVRSLSLVSNETWVPMLEGESEKQKQYTALIWLSRVVTDAEVEAVTDMKDLEIQQKTPVRVLHRRSPLVRPRTIHWMRFENITGSQQYFLLHLCTQAGTYIKEFVHGDLGRTHPNVGSLFECEAEILQLDVTDIKMDLFK